MTLTRMFDETYADVIAVLHESKLIYERYAGAPKLYKPHVAMSVTIRSPARWPAFWLPRARSICGHRSRFRSIAAVHRSDHERLE
ncbi:hypothetical protein AB7813_06715 [Tardiphaga sp. 20_F10_N6_6]|uniref:hypothetical protein n=1 Tax=unclassified Tardiphaga TaxID=2631404 RepID=UPI003F273E0C